jgi:hypothetical protein
MKVYTGVQGADLELDTGTGIRIFHNRQYNRHFLCQILLCTNAVLDNLPQNRDNFLKKYF